LSKVSILLGGKSVIAQIMVMKFFVLLASLIFIYVVTLIAKKSSGRVKIGNVSLLLLSPVLWLQ